jgi:hypothetical protein
MRGMFDGADRGRLDAVGVGASLGNRLCEATGAGMRWRAATVVACTRSAQAGWIWAWVGPSAEDAEPVGSGQVSGDARRLCGALPGSVVVVFFMRTGGLPGATPFGPDPCYSGAVRVGHDKGYQGGGVGELWEVSLSMCCLLVADGLHLR